jgi:ribosomal protein S18 acetylase RimI-like enzyme
VNEGRVEGLEIRSYEPSDESSVIALWRECGLQRSWNDPHLDILRKRAHKDGLFLVAQAEGIVVGTVMAGYDGHRGSINYLGVSAGHRKKGIGRALMREAEQRLSRLGCPKINLQVRAENPEAVEFYRRLGFETFEVIDMGKRLIADYLIGDEAG